MTRDGPPQPGGVPVERSLFVTAVAWTFIVLAGASILGALCQGGPALSTASAPQGGRTGPAGALWLPFLPLYWPVLFAVHLALSLVALAAAVGLLRRRRWARTLFMVVLVFGIAASAGLVLVQFGSIVRLRPVLAGGAPVHILVVAVALLVSLLVSVAACVALGSILARLTLEEYKREFS